MKKYVKPELIFESFEMNQQVASCDFELVEGTNNNSTCEFTGTDSETGFTVTIFLNGSIACINNTAEDYCYFGSTAESFNIFNS